MRVFPFLAGLVVCAIAPALAEDDGLTWTDNYQQALEEARRTGKPIFLEFRCEP